MPTCSKPSFLVAVVVFWLIGAGSGFGQELFAVLTSDLGPYREAFDGFQAGFGQKVPFAVLSGPNQDVPAGSRVVAAFGGKAALALYPDTLDLLYCLAPGIDSAQIGRSGKSIAVRMHPREERLAEKVKEIQPGAKRIAVLWISGSFEKRVEKIRGAFAGVGIELLSEQMTSTNEIPDRLRTLFSRNIDALWLMPDPLLINARSFRVLKEFSWSNRVPLYSPSAGLVEQGATAALSTGYYDIGKVAGSTARQLLQGVSVPGEIYPDKMQITLNMKAISLLGLKIPEAILLDSDKVLQ